jgi:hypothetical protein
LRFQGAKAEAAATAARRKAEFEALLEKTYSLEENDSHLGQLYKLANSAAAEANEQIACLARRFGTHLQFGPSLKISYGDWPQHARHCSKNDRWRAAHRISRLETEAAAQIERTSTDTLIQLMGENLALAEAKKLVEAIPAAADLIPELKREDLNCEPDHPRYPGDDTGVGDDDLPF